MPLARTDPEKVNWQERLYPGSIGKDDQRAIPHGDLMK
jgi:hypothetical protein